jgi:hypothetical protein
VTAPWRLRSPGGGRNGRLQPAQVSWLSPIRVREPADAAATRFLKAAQPSHDVPNRTPSPSVEADLDVARCLDARVVEGAHDLLPPSAPRVPFNAPPVPTVSMCKRHEDARQAVAPRAGGVDVADPVDANFQARLDHPLHAAAGDLGSASLRRSRRPPRSPEPRRRRRRSP